MTSAEPQEPLYLRIASSLRDRISSGDLAPGTKLPSQNELAKEWETTRPTVAQAMEAVRREGLILTTAKSGSFVRHQPVLEVRSSDRYRRPSRTEETSPFARDAKREGARPDWTWETTRIRADEQVAERLDIAAGDFVMRTDYVFRADGRPVQSSRSWEPYDIVGGTEVEEPEGEGRVTGVIARMDLIGVEVDRVVEVVRARPASPVERKILEIVAEVWVQHIERTHWAEDRRVEIADIVIPADRYALEYDIPVHGDPT